MWDITTPVRQVHVSLSATLGLPDYSSVKVTVGFTEPTVIEDGENPTVARKAAAKALTKDLEEILEAEVARLSSKFESWKE